MSTGPSGSSQIAAGAIGLTIWVLWAFVEGVDSRSAPDRWLHRERDKQPPPAPVVRPPPPSPMGI